MGKKAKNGEVSAPEYRIAGAIRALVAGKGVLLADDENRENEGDLVFAAEKMTVSQMALMIRECSGIVCLCMEKEAAKRLGLPPMTRHNTSRYGTAFTVSIEAARGITTGVSAADRIATIQTAISPGAAPEDLTRPGHVFPLVARENGVFARAGHTEGSVDLMKLAKLSAFAVLCELMNEDGTMARMPEIAAFSEKHGFPVVTIADIRAYRQGLENGKQKTIPHAV
ncbi:3,4-dihydroxy-2-butanone-4-phosphate synthase [Oxalobacter paraformigenes]|uniref:3,4-dihydroxy-2-butanone 4-phosphate synthase n=1 Tax=Oxalobacter paraformigenes TaxID=556268 RepID=C3X332_9BURK|nr:3,4-dihydroxy-2-butanone-4-phosphate synthase [Oxalobacter paraformigenes]EEO27618.2 3,4-dihydroxy-2-butanone-4-phosphate synthase [Oxalobacter paraformigenes]